MRSILLAVHQDAQAAFQNVLEASRPDLQQVVALSPAQARDAFLTWQSELVIVDARLSLGGMLDFVGWLQRQSPDTQIIALCELDSFAQVQRVLRPDTADYLIHPFRPEELLRLLSSLEERRAVLQELSASLRPVIDRARDEAVEARCLHLICGLAEGSLSRQEQDELRAKLQAPGGAALIAAAPDPDGMDAASDILETYLGGVMGIRIARDTERNQLLALVWISPQHHTEWLRKQLIAAVEHLRYARGVALDIGVSLMFGDLIKEGAKAFEQAAQAFSYRFYHTQGSVTQQEDNAFAPRQGLPDLDPIADAVEKAGAAGKGLEAREALERMIQQIDTWPRPQPQRVRRYMQRLSQRLIYTYGGEAAQSLAEQATAAFSASQSLAALAEAAQRTVQALLPKREDIGEAVALCMESLQRDPALPLSLEEAAQRCCVDPQALDEGIRRSTGLSFLLYQRQLRIAKAQGLFDQTDLPLAAVSEQAGYADPAHFARVYQKVTGSLPPR